MLNDKSQYVVSRNVDFGDLILIDDTSISREHAILFPEKDVLFLMDQKSKYGTYVNGNIEPNIPIEKNKKIEIRHGDKIRFGRLNNVWRLEKVKVAFLSSTLSIPEKKDLLADMNILNGIFLDKWSDECTHLTMSKVTITMKVLHALAGAVPIVTPIFWKDMIKAAKEQHPLPNPENYLPPIVEPFMNKEANINVNINRKRLFAGKTFLFMVKNHMDRFKLGITLASGTCFSMDERKLQKQMLLKPGNIVVQYTPSTQSQASDDILKVTNYLRTNGLRSIPDCEIGLAILNCSTVKFCNPQYDLEQDFIQSNVKVSETIIAEETPQTSKSNNHLENIVVPATETILSETLTEKCSKRKCLSPLKESRPTKKKLTESKTPQLLDVCSPINSICKTDTEPFIDENTNTDKQSITKRKPAEANDDDLFAIPQKIPTLNKSLSINSQIDVSGFLSKSFCPRPTPTNTTKELSPDKSIAPASNNKRRLNLLGNVAEDDLFQFGRKKRAKLNDESQIENNSSRFFNSGTSNRTNQQTRNGGSQSQQEIIKPPNKPKNEKIDCNVTAVPLTMDGWLSKSLKSSLIIKEEPADEVSGDVKTEESKEWIRSMRNAFEVRVKKMNLVSAHTVSICKVDGENDTTNGKPKNFKAFVKKFNYRPQTVVIRTMPLISTQQLMESRLS